MSHLVRILIRDVTLDVTDQNFKQKLAGQLQTLKINVYKIKCLITSNLILPDNLTQQLYFNTKINSEITY